MAGSRVGTCRWTRECGFGGQEVAVGDGSGGSGGGCSRGVWRGRVGRAPYLMELFCTLSRVLHEHRKRRNAVVGHKGHGGGGCR